MFFLNPFAMVVGGALVSAPILIHLINRMRFKRIRWAAMEFLLKSQKRNRRRLIIEQLILLMLRCLLVLLAGFLVARFVGQAMSAHTELPTTHVVVLDDTLSMADRTPKGQAPGPDCFTRAKQQIEELAEAARKSDADQFMHVYTVCGEAEAVFSGKLDETGLANLRKSLKDVRPTLVHADAAPAVARAKEKLGEAGDHKRWLHVVSDFREPDWARSDATVGLHKAVEDVAQSGARVTFIDVAAPPRAGVGRKVDFHGNFAVTDLKPEKRVAPAATSVPFSVEVENLGNESLPALKINVFVDGVEDLFATRVYEPAPSPGTRQRYGFDLLFREGPPDGQKSRFYRVSAVVEKVDAESGLLEDNARHAFIEIRKEVPTLVIDGAGPDGSKVGGDTRVIRDVLESIKRTEAVKVVVGTVEGATKEKPGLCQPDLSREYAAIYLLNLENLVDNAAKDDKGKSFPLEQLRKYVQSGGNVVFFTGDKVNIEYYNKTLYQQEKGLFPVPLADQATVPLTPEEIDKRRQSLAPKLYVLEKDHDITRGIYPQQHSIPDLIIPQHTPAKERFDWVNDWTREGDISVLITFAGKTKLNNDNREQVRARTSGKLKLLLDDAALKRFHPLLEKHKKVIEQRVFEGRDDDLYMVASAVDDMFADGGEKPGEKGNISLKEFWSLPEARDTRSELLAWQKNARYGDPLCIARKHGAGNVVAFLTTAGEKWSGWSGGKNSGLSAAVTFPMVVADLQKFLTRGGDLGQRLVGERVEIPLDPKQFKREAKLLVQRDLGAAEKKAEKDAPPGFLEPRDLPLADGEQALTVEFDQPGVHFVRLSPQAGREPEERWFAVNIDTSIESNLRRAADDDIVRKPATPSEARGKVALVGEVGELAEKLIDQKNDASESPWLYIVILLVLVAEQALAVHLSFHVKGGEASTPVPVAAPAGGSQAAA